MSTIAISPLPALVVFGPFMSPEQRAAFAARAARLPNVHAITFNARLEALMARAAGVVAMGGYNTFCEILSFDKPALIMPRTAPRLEQLSAPSAPPNLASSPCCRSSRAATRVSCPRRCVD